MRNALLLFGFFALDASAISVFPVASAPSMSSAAVTWRTDVTGSSQIQYGLTSAYGSSTTLDRTQVTAHRQFITGLQPGTVYHFKVVSTDGSGNTASSADRTFTTLPSPTGVVKIVNAAGGKDYTTISGCAQAAVAGSTSGWTCEVLAGTYNERVPISNFSGRSDNQITFVANGTVVVAGFVISNSSYINIQGFDITTTFAGSSYQTCATNYDAVNLTSSSYITIANNYFNFIYNGMFIRWVTYGITSDHVKILNNIMEFTDMKSYTGNPATDATCGTPSGGWMAIEGWGNYNLFDGNDIQDADHFFVVSGSYNVIRNNIVHDSNPADFGSDDNLTHLDFFHPLPTSGSPNIHNLIENNRHYRCGTANQHFLLIDDTVNAVGTSHDVVVRFNSTDYVGSYFLVTSYGGVPGIRLYNNTIANQGPTLASYAAQWGNNSSGGTALNNIFYNAVTNPGSLVNFDGTSAYGQVPSFNLAYNSKCGSGCTWQSSVTSAPGAVLNQDPLFVNSAGYDFNLQAESPARLAGTYLTTVADRDSGSGTSLVVKDAGFFQDGSGIVNADWIRVGTTSAVQISSINYATNTITLANAIQRSPKDPVYLYKDSSGNTVLFGTAPDIGAYQYGSGPVGAPPANLTALAQ
jgi:hypothetical protein